VTLCDLRGSVVKKSPEITWTLRIGLLVAFFVGSAMACSTAAPCPEVPPASPPPTTPVTTGLSTPDPTEIWVPEGPFRRGCKADVCPSDETPERDLTLPGFWIDRRLVTVREYGHCVDAGACSAEGLDAWGAPADPIASKACPFGAEGGADRPLACVTRPKAEAYCAFAGKTLPTEAQWEKAFRAVGAPLADLFARAPESIDSAPRESFWEWTRDLYDPANDGRARPPLPASGPSGPGAGALVSIRGVRVLDVADVRAPEWETPSLRLSTRTGVDPSARSLDLGFRCVRNAVTPSPSGGRSVGTPSPSGGPGKPPLTPAALTIESAIPDPAFWLRLGRLTGLCDAAPAWVSSDRAETALCTSDPGGPGPASAAVYFYDPASDKLTAQLPITRPLDLLSARLRRFLTGFEPLVEYATSEDRRHPHHGALAVPPLEARGEGLWVRYTDPVLTITDEKGHAILRGKMEWRATAQDTGCHTERFEGAISAVRGNRKQKVFFLTLASVNASERCGATSHFVRAP